MIRSGDGVGVATRDSTADVAVLLNSLDDVKVLENILQL